MYRQYFKKFLDNPAVVFSYLRSKLFYSFIADRVSNSYRDYNFLSGRETITRITEKDTSLIRAGDGTFGYLLGSSIYFNNWQFRYNRSFAKRLREVMTNPQKANILFCYPHTFIRRTKADFIKEKIADEWRIWVPIKVMLRKFLRSEVEYGDALCFHPKYNPGMDFQAIKNYFDSKHIIIITSNVARFADIKFGKSITFIESPSSDAWQVYKELTEKGLAAVAKNQLAKNEVLFMISAAEAAKVMVYDLTLLGYTAWDTGQFFDLANQEIKTLGSDSFC